jgi:hypothetical protein
MAERKSTAVLIKLSPAEKRALDAAARRENLPMATWMRALCLHAARAANEKGHTMTKAILIAAVLGLAACGGTEPVSDSANWTPDRSSAAALCSSICDTAETTTVDGNTCDCRCGVTAHSYEAKGIFDLTADAQTSHDYWNGLAVNCDRPPQCHVDADCRSGDVCDPGSTGGICITSCANPNAACIGGETCRANGHCS